MHVAQIQLEVAKGEQSYSRDKERKEPEPIVITRIDSDQFLVVQKLKLPLAACS